MRVSKAAHIRTVPTRTLTATKEATREQPAYLRQTGELISAHCGDAEAQKMLAEAKARAIARPTRRLAVAQCWPATPTDDIWTELWSAFAARRPDLFGSGLAELSAEPSGVSLAFLYVREQHPHQLRAGLRVSPWLTIRAEKEQRRRLDALARRSGIVLPKVEANYWRVEEGCVLHDYLMQHPGWAGISLFCEPSLRSDTFVLQPHEILARGSSYAILTLHELIHQALTELACPQQTVRLTPLRAKINEGVVETLTRAANGGLDDTFDAWAETMRYGSYTRETVALYSLLPPLGPETLGPILELGIENLRARTDKETASALSELAGVKRSATAWLAYINSRRQARRVRWIDGGDSLWRNGVLHREDGPAMEYGNGTREWLRDGYPHRDPWEGPALIVAPGATYRWPGGSNNDGGVEWRSIIGPAQRYFREGELHREDGPASEDADGTREWVLRGFRHRHDGPAVELWTGAREWWYGNKLHRKDGPAVEFANGTREWWWAGELHREDGPAVEYADGRKEWYRWGKKKRKPARAKTKPRNLATA